MDLKKIDALPLAAASFIPAAIICPHQVSTHITININILISNLSNFLDIKRDTMLSITRSFQAPIICQ